MGRKLPSILSQETVASRKSDEKSEVDLSFRQFRHIQSGNSNPSPDPEAKALRLRLELNFILLKAYLISRQINDANSVLSDIGKEGRKTDDPELHAQIKFWTGITLLMDNRPAEARKKLEKAQAQFHAAMRIGRDCPESHMVRPWLERAEKELEQEQARAAPEGGKQSEESSHVKGQTEETMKGTGVGERDIKRKLEDELFVLGVTF